MKQTSGTFSKVSSNAMDIVVDDIAKMQANGLKPGHIILGTSEFEALQKDEYESMKIQLPDGEGMLWGLSIVLDTFSHSRMDVVPEASFRTYRRLYRPAGK